MDVMAVPVSLVLAAISGAGDPPRPGEDLVWVVPMKEVHARFHGKHGTFAHFGDSITVTMAYWAPLEGSAKNGKPAFEEALGRVRGYLAKECWRGRKGPRFGNEGGMTIRWAAENVDRWLKEMNPETALVMFGTNDLGQLELEEYRSKTREVAGKCLANGTVVILSTIPPRHGMEEKGRKFAAAVREIAGALKVPLVDFHAEVLRRRPGDWDGALEQFAAFKDYEVPTLISRDGIHPSYPRKWADDYSEEGLSHSGYGLRSYLVLLAYDGVLREVLKSSGRRPHRRGRRGRCHLPGSILNSKGTPGRRIHLRGREG